MHPYLLYSSTHLCTQQQKLWWQTVLEDLKPANDFYDHLATIRLDEDRLLQFPPKSILFNTARILFEQALKLFSDNLDQYALALSYEQYADHYFKMAKKDRNLSDSLNKSSTTTNTRSEKLFFFYVQKFIQSVEKNPTDSCEKLAQKCEEMKSKIDAETQRTSSPTVEQKGEIY